MRRIDMFAFDLVVIILRSVEDNIVVCFKQFIIKVRIDAR